MQDIIVIGGDCSLLQTIDGDAELLLSTDGDVGIFMPVNPPAFAGPYSATPTAEEQRIPMQGFMAAEDFVVGPIPNNYGLITWDGSTLTVS